MSYKVVKKSGARPYRIVNKTTRRVVGTSKSLAKAKRSIKHREDYEAAPKNIKKFKRKVDNKMRDYGETDYNKRVVRVNKSKKKNKRGDIIDTIVHEKMHIEHPRKHEKTVRKDTKKLIARMGRKAKSKHYSLFRG